MNTGTGHDTLRVAEVFPCPESLTHRCVRAPHGLASATDSRRAADAAVNSESMMTPTERFWSKVRKTDTCWLWTACMIRGYGQVAWNGKPRRAPRVSWEIHNGPVPAGLLVLHRCDTPACVNPAHLFLGTHTDNMRDAKAKGRLSCGDNHYRRKHPEGVERGEASANARFTEADVLAIRTEQRAGLGYKRIARALNLPVWRVQQVTRGNTWRHVT